LEVLWTGEKPVNRLISRKFTVPTVFLLAVFSLGSLNLLTYPYIPENGIFLTAFLILTSSIFGVLAWKEKTQPHGVRGIVFCSFIVTTLVSRVFVNTSGIGTPKSTGTLGPVTVEQIWMGGFHLHHYWLGIAALAFSAYMWREKFSQVKTAAVFGAGLALVVDEIGIILAGHTYHSPLSYLCLMLTNALLLGLLLKEEGFYFNQ
jgi:hypothetical protein